MHGDDAPLADDRAGGGEGGGDLGRVVRVVVVDAARRATVPCSSKRRPVPANLSSRRGITAGVVAEADEHREGAGGVERVVRARASASSRRVVAPS